jgi:hypothetical protein
MSPGLSRPTGGLEAQQRLPLIHSPLELDAVEIRDLKEKLETAILFLSVREQPR